QGNQRIRKVDTGGNISTVAGNGTAGFGGDGAAATAAELNQPVGVAVDSAGNLYVADQGNQRIRKVDTSGNISTVASISNAGVAVDSAGNLYIADQNNQRIRKLDANGNISTVAGSGTAGFAGDGAAASAAELNQPAGVAVDSAGNLYVADQGNQRIRKVDTSGNISTVASISNAGVAVDSAGNLYIADQNNQRIRKLDANGNISTVAGSGTAGFAGDGAAASAAELNQPAGVAVDSAGNLYVADQGNQRIRKVDTGGNISTVAGNGTAGFGGDGAAATAAELNQPVGVAVDSAGNLYVADQGNQRIRKVDTSGNISTVASISNAGVAVDSAGNLYVADQGNQRIRKVDTGGNISTVAGNGTAGFGGDGAAATAAELNQPVGVAVDSAGNLYVADQGNQRIRKVDT